MSARSIPNLVTVEEYERMPDPPGGRYELHHGEVVFVTFPVREHKELQRRLRKLLEPLAAPLYFLVDTEYPYRPLPENEVWGADVACLLTARDRSSEKWLEGSPELVIEVRSRSNTKAELHDKAMTALAGSGSSEFWVVDSPSRTVTVYSKAGGMHVYGAGATIPVPLLESQILLDEVFTGL